MHERLLLATPSCLPCRSPTKAGHAEVERRRKSPNRTKAGSGRLTTASPSCGGRACHAETLAKAGRLRFSLLWRRSLP